MRFRAGIVWALAMGVGLAFLLIMAGQPGYAAGLDAGMSAPAPQKHSIESTASAQLFIPQFDSRQPALRAGSIPPAPVAAWPADDAREDAVAARSYYGPLHRRPPPSFS